MKPRAKALAANALALVLSLAWVPAVAQPTASSLHELLSLACNATGFSADDRASALRGFAKVDTVDLEDIALLNGRVIAATNILDGTFEARKIDELAENAAKGLLARLTRAEDRNVRGAVALVAHHDDAQILIIDHHANQRVEFANCTWLTAAPGPSLLDELVRDFRMFPGDFDKNIQVWRASASKKTEDGNIQYSRTVAILLDNGKPELAMLRYGTVAHSF